MTTDLFIVTGKSNSNKEDVSRALAARLNKSAYVDGEIFLRMIENGGANLDLLLNTEARSQIKLCRELSAHVVISYMRAGFSVVYSDSLLGPDLLGALERLWFLSPKVVVLNPLPAGLVSRGQKHDKTRPSLKFPTDPSTDTLIAETPRIGLWIETSPLDVEQVVERVIETYSLTAHAISTR